MRQKLYNQTWVKYICYTIFAWLVATSISSVAGYRITEINMVIPMLMVGILYVIMQFEKSAYKKWYKSALCFSIPFALTLVLGSGFDMDERVFLGYSILAPLYFVILTIFFMRFTVNIMKMLNNVSFGLEVNADEKSKWTWILASSASFIAWIPYYLTYCPGIISLDYLVILNQCVGNTQMTNHHPVLYVLAIKAIIAFVEPIGGMQLATAVVTLVQMILFALILGYMAHWLYNKGIGKIGYGLTVTFIALNPVIALFSVYVTKDVLFGAVFLLYILHLFDVVESRGEILKTGKGFLHFILLNLLVVLLRNNGIYITVLLLVISFFLYRNIIKRIIASLVIVLVVYGLLTGPIFDALDIAGGSFAEALSVPLQQVAQTICDDGNIAEADKVFLDRLMPLEKVKEVYLPGYTDPYKFDAAFDDDYLNANKGKFLMVWARLIPNNLGSYIKAYLMQTAGYWHIGETDSLSTYGVVQNEFGLIQNNVIENIAGISLEPIIEKLILACRKAPVFCFVTNMAFMVFLVYFICIRCFINGKKQYILPFLPMLLLWATIMVAAPAYCKFRYLFPYHLAYPFMVWVLLCVSGNAEGVCNRNEDDCRKVSTE